MATPATFDIFSRMLAGSSKERNYVRLRTAGQKFFGRPGNGFTAFSRDANALDIEIVRSNQKLAPLMPRGMVGRFIGSLHQDVQFDQGTMFSRKYPFIEETANIGADQINYRVIGDEAPYENLTDADRLRILGQRAYIELSNRVFRTQEFLAWQALTLGIQSVQSLSDTTVNIYDYRRASANTVTPTHGWGNALGVPLTDIDSLCDQLLFIGQEIPTFMVWGGTTMKYFLNNSQVTTAYANKLYFELLRFELGQGALAAEFAPFVEAGLIPFGQIKTPKGYSFTIFTYPYMYDSSTTATKTAAKYFGDTLCLMGSTTARCDRYFGPNETMPMGPSEGADIMAAFGFNPATPPITQNVEGSGTLLPQMVYSDAYRSPDRKHWTVRVQGAPVFVPVQTDAWGTMTVGTTS